ncbi:hypothetical protein [Acinetobacter sp. MB5]|uniref:hypothetical protein n=1 Tax=Acinetobacter sp. MB5 TaxID=2069438 RepID=UPI000DD0393D|nr:hypothetical protein [Acinetobacter sp. MB5]
MKKTIILFTYLVMQNSFASNSPFQLVNQAFEKGDQYEPSYTTYYYKTAQQLQPIQVKYVYQHNIDIDQDELTILFNSKDTQNTFITGLLSVNNPDHILSLLNLAKAKVKYPCHYSGQAEIQVQEIDMIVNKIAGESYGFIDLNQFKPLTSPQKSCRF